MGHKILLADDSITIQKVIELTFSDEDFELHTVGNGQKAIDEVRSIMPHIVLCDIIMPEKNGYEVCEFIKTSSELRHIPVLLLTGAFEPFDQERARNAGCDGFLAKPFEPQTLISKVKELLAKAPSAAPAAAKAPAPAPGSDERAVLVPPPGRPATPPRGPQAVPPSPPPPPAVDYGAGIDDAFAVEAGERELMMDPGDRTVLLGDAARSPGSSGDEGDDIWGEVTAKSEPEPQEEDSSTVFMAAPPPLSKTETPQTYSSSDFNEIQYEGEDRDATWRAGGESPGKALSPDYGGFEDFAGAEFSPPPIPEPPAEEAAATKTPPPPAGAASSKESLVDDASEFEPESFDSDATIDSVVREERYGTIPGSSGFEEFGEPEILDEKQAASGEPVFEAEADPDEAFDEIDAPAPSAGDPQEAARNDASPSSSGGASVAIDDALIERVAQRVVDKLSSKVIQEIAWEVVPDLAEGLIQREIEALKAKQPK